MTTRNATPSARRFRPLLVLVAGVLVMLAVGGGLLAGATDPPCKETPRPDAAQSASRDAAPTVADARARVAATPAAAAPTGLDLEVRIWNLRIEFPWLKSLPLRPGRHIVVSIFETPRSQS